MPGEWKTIGVARKTGFPRTARIFGTMLTAAAVLLATAWAPAPAEDLDQGDVRIVSTGPSGSPQGTPTPDAKVSPGGSTGASTGAAADGHAPATPTPPGIPGTPGGPAGPVAPGTVQAAEASPTADTRAARLGGWRHLRLGHRRASRQTCPPTSIICIENSLPGSPPSEWDVPGAGSPAITGYATQMSVNAGQTQQFKVNAPSITSYRIDIYRVGYYSGLGARKIATVNPSVPLPQSQPACLNNTATGLVDCGNWSVSASWAVPADTVSGVYLANFVRTDGTSGVSQNIFVVRNDARNSDILVQTSDATWQAYNTYGGNSLYKGLPVGRAFKVSYNRPVITRAGWPETYFFNAEYPMIRWLESNSYDVSYTSSVDTVTSGAQLLNHKVLFSSGHDEYWSQETRDNVINAKNKGVNIAFFTGNEMFWKTRWESSIDPSATPNRTMVCYKETVANMKIDPSPTWTGTWRDPRFAQPPNGGYPENALTGTLFMINGNVNNAITVPAEYAPMRLWRNTSVANLQPGQVATFPNGTLGYEWDEAPDNSFAPAGLVLLSRTTLASPNKFLLDFGATYGAGVATHSLVLYRDPSGAYVFGAGTIQWSWGLDAVHDRPGTPTDIRMQQATVNLLADMRTQPATLQAGLVPATPSADTAPPTSTITTPSSGASVPGGTTVTVAGTASDTGGGVVAGVEVSVDGGTTWHRATGRTNWQYAWTTTSNQGPVTIRSRAVDDIGNVQRTPAGRSVTVNAGCPCSIWSPDTVPATITKDDRQPVEVGVRFRVRSPGYISGIRFYKGPLNTGTHVGSLWTNTGQLLAQATFTSETASGWQQVNFSTPVPVNNDVSYVASYHTNTGNYSVNRDYFVTQYSNGLITGLADGADGGNGLYTYSKTSTFPTSTYRASNAWVDVVYSQATTLWDESATPDIIAQPDTKAVTLGVKFQSSVSGAIRGIRFYKSTQNTGVHVGSLWTVDGQLLANVTFTNETPSGWQQALFSTPVNITPGTTYIASYFTPTGFYALDRDYFTTQYSRGPLTAPSSTASGGNGVYAYAGANTFPTATYRASNYWVDVLFDPAQMQAAARRALRYGVDRAYGNPVPLSVPRSLPGRRPAAPYAPAPFVRRSGRPQHGTARAPMLERLRYLVPGPAKDRKGHRARSRSITRSR